MDERINSLTSLYPPFADLVAEMLNNIRAEGLNAYVFETYRSYARQLQLYSLGRKKVDGKWVIVDKTLIVTNALPGYSLHAYGLAVDFAFDGNTQKQGIQWTWDDADLTRIGIQPLPWDNLGIIGEKVGMEWAGRWKRFCEYPHMQKLYGFKRDDLYPILMSGGIEAVWKMIDKSIKPKEPLNSN